MRDRNVCAERREWPAARGKDLKFPAKLRHSFCLFKSGDGRSGFTERTRHREARYFAGLAVAIFEQGSDL